MLGGALMLLLGVLSPLEAVLAINLDVILLLIGMMVLVSGLEVCGFFDLVSSRIAARAKSQLSFLTWLMIATATLSALVLNDAIALLVTPVVIRSARFLKVNPVPYLVAVAIAANVGSVATAVPHRQGRLGHHPLLRRPVPPPGGRPRLRALGRDPGSFHVRPWRAGRWTRLARRPVLAPFEPDQQRPRGLAPRGGRPARLDPTLAGARRELDIGRQRDDLGGRVQCDRRTG